MLLYIVCQSTQHLRSINILFQKYRIDRLRIGILIYPDLAECRELVEISKHVKHVLIDNGAYVGKQYSIEILAKAYVKASKYFKDVKVILPDVVEDSENTVKKVKEAVRYISNLSKYAVNIKARDFVPVIQGKNLDDYINCLREISRTCTFTDLYAIGGLKKKRQSERRRIVEEVCRLLQRKHKRVHVLGTDLTLIRYVKKIPNIRSIDTANWTWEVTKGGLALPNGNRILVREDDEYWRSLPWEEKLALNLYNKLLRIRSILENSNS